MKTLKTTIFLMLAAAALTACDSEDEATQPTAKIEIEQDTYNINESMTVHFTGNAENVVIYTGDSGHDYELREQSNTGWSVRGDLWFCRGCLHWAIPVPESTRWCASSPTTPMRGRW